jgi:cystathionine gamma-synthase
MSSNDQANSSKLTPETLAVHAGRPSRVPGAPLSTPITLSSTYVHTAAIEYGRDGNDGWSALETALAALDGGRALTFASGLASATAIASLVPAGGKVVLPQAAYYGVKGIFQALERNKLIELVLVDGSDTAAYIEASHGAHLVWMESIANPTMVVTDIPTITTAAKANGAITVVDATFATPLRQKPLEYGVDIVMHSVTKYLAGHSDLLLGAAITNSAEIYDQLFSYRHDHGAIPGGLETYLALRGVRTLGVRLERAEANALDLSQRLASHPRVTKVNYPGRVGDSQYEVAQKVLPDGASAMMSFELDATPEQVDSMLEGLNLITHATSLGGVESLIERRARYAPEANAGVPLTLCRFSVGIENVEDLWQDLATALAQL